MLFNRSRRAFSLAHRERTRATPPPSLVIHPSASLARDVLGSQFAATRGAEHGEVAIDLVAQQGDCVENPRFTGNGGCIVEWSAHQNQARCQRRRMASMWRQLKWSRAEKSRRTVEETMGAPRVANEFSKCGMPWRSNVRKKVPATQRGRTRPSHARRRLGRKGVEKPVRMLFSRLAEMGISTVTTRVRKPARSTRSMSASMRA